MSFLHPDRKNLTWVGIIVEFIMNVISTIMFVSVMWYCWVVDKKRDILYILIHVLILIGVVYILITVLKGELK